MTTSDLPDRARAKTSITGPSRTCTRVTSSTYSGGSTIKRYNDSWVAILVTLPSNYGSTGLANNGWWKISYTIPTGVQATDTTTWKVSVRGNPVHLIVP